MKIDTLSEHSYYRRELDKLTPFTYTALVVTGLPREVNQDIKDIAEWVRTNVAKEDVLGTWSRAGSNVNAVYCFRNEEDAVAFRLRFSEINDD